MNKENTKFNKFMPLVKVEETATGTLMVYGQVTAQEPDQSDEICDYASTKPYYKAVTDEIAKSTSAVEGMETSIMPLREMHQALAVGKGTIIEFLDEARKIMMGFEVVEPSTILKVKKGILRGFSQGGEYIKRWTDKKFPGKTFYTSKPGEVSLVDNPCLSSCLVESLVAKAALNVRDFEYVKADGSHERREMQPVEKHDAGICACPCPMCKSGSHVGCSAEPCCKLETNDHVIHLSASSAAEIGASTVKALQPMLDRIISAFPLGKRQEEPVAVKAFAYLGTADDPTTLLPIDTEAHAKASLARLKSIPQDAQPAAKAKIIAAIKSFGGDMAVESEKAFAAFNEVGAIHRVNPGLALAAISAFSKGKEFSDKFAKSMYDVQDLVSVMRTLSNVEFYLFEEREFEGDDSKIPEMLHQVLEDLVQVFLELVDEETSELLAHTPVGSAAATKNGGDNSMKYTPEQLQAAADFLNKAAKLDHITKALGCIKANHDAAVAMHKSHMDSMHSMNKAHHDAIHKATSVEHAKTLATAHFGKVNEAVTDHFGKVSAMHKAQMDEMTGHIQKAIEAATGDDDGQPVPITLTAGGEAHAHGSKAFTADDLAKLETTLLDKVQTSVLEMMKSLLTPGAEEVAAPAAAGIGNRALTASATRKAVIPAGARAPVASGALVAEDLEKRGDGQQPAASNVVTMTPQLIAKIAAGQGTADDIRALKASEIQVGAADMMHTAAMLPGGR